MYGTGRQTGQINRHLMIEFGLVEFGRTKTSILAKTHLLILHILQSTQAII